MKIDKSKLKKYIIIFLFICLCFMITDKLVKADTYYTTYADTQTYYDNNGSSVSKVGETWNESLHSYVSNSIRTTANSYGAGVVINTPIPILSGHSYTLSIPFTEMAYSLSLSSKNRIAIGMDINGTAYNYANSNFYSNTLYSKVVNGKTLQFAFSANGGGNYLFIPWTTLESHSQTYFLTSFIIEDLGASGISESTINNSLNNQTNIINNSINASTNDIKNNSNANRDAIINNQNENTDKIIEENNKNMNSCNTSAKFEYNKGKYFNNSGNLVSKNDTFYSDMIYVKGAGVLTITGVSGATYTYSKFILYDKNKKFIDWYELRNRTISLTDDVYYIAISSDIKTTKISYQNEVCINRLDEQTNSINGLNDSLTDTAAPDSPDFGNSLDVSSMTPITDLITMPITLYNKIISESNKSCSSYSIPFGLVSGSDYTLTFPCIDIGNYLGSKLKGIIDDLFCLFMIYEICMLGITIFNDATSLKDSFDSLYVPRHSSDIPRHGGPVNYG